MGKTNLKPSLNLCNVRLLLCGHETFVHFSANSDVRCTLIDDVIVLRASSRCQKTHLKIKRVVGGGGVRILDDVNHLSDGSLQISHQQMYRVECDFIVF
jgi:ribosomal protein S27E